MATIVQARYLPMLAPFISTEETRYYLNGVFIEPHPETGALLVATDGYHLGVIHDETAECDKAAIWPIDPYLVKWLTEWKWEAMREDDEEVGMSKERRDIDEMVARFDGRHVDILSTGGKSPLHFSAASEPIDGTYPDWRKVLNKEAKDDRSGHGFDPKFLGAFASVGECIRIHFPAANRPAVIRVDSVPEFFGLLMPKTFQTDDTEMPAWLKPAA